MQTFKTHLFTMQNRPANVQDPFVHDAKPSCKRSRPFCSRRKTSMQTFKALLFMMQNRPANIQDPFVHDAKPSCKHSRADCWCYHTGLKSNKTHLFILYLVKLKSFIRKFVHSFPVGAYRIRPDVSERATYSHKTPITELKYKNGSIANKYHLQIKKWYQLARLLWHHKKRKPCNHTRFSLFQRNFFNPNSPYNSLTLNNIRRSYCYC